MFQVKIRHEKKDYSKVTSKCGSMENAKHKAGGGAVKVIYASNYVNTHFLSKEYFF